MTDNRDTLHLVERLAKRLSQENEIPESVQPASGMFAERGVQKASPGTVPVASAVIARNTPLEDPAPVAPSPAHGGTGHAMPASSPAAADSGAKQIRLDFRALRQNGMITPDNMASQISNEFRGIKRRLLQKVRDPITRSYVNNLIMVTSALPGEGKTFSSINLALSLAAERGLRVLLIDVDVIRPSVGNVFVSPPREGLTDLLGGKVTQVSDVMYRCAEIPNLSVIFAGNPTPNSPELISSGKMVQLCRDLSAQYPDRVIIMDSPPVLATPEPAILAGYVHQLVMVVAAAQADKHQIRKALEAVSSCQNISMVFNRAPSWNEAEYTAYYGYAGPTATSASSAPEA
jgi:receptor protein-tyrosine kinase